MEASKWHWQCCMRSLVLADKTYLTADESLFKKVCSSSRSRCPTLSVSYQEDFTRFEILREFFEFFDSSSIFLFIFRQQLLSNLSFTSTQSSQTADCFASTVSVCCCHQSLTQFAHARVTRLKVTITREKDHIFTVKTGS